MEHLAGMSPSREVLVFYWSPEHDWQTRDISQITGQKIASSLTSWQTPDGPRNVEHLAGVNSNKDVLVYYWSADHNYTTQHYDNRRSGWNPHETALTVADVRQKFGHLGSDTALVISSSINACWNKASSGDDNIRAQTKKGYGKENFLEQPYELVEPEILLL